MKLVVAERAATAKDIVVLELRRQDQAPLPPFEPGAHIDVSLPNGLVRQYSLLNDCRERDRYLLGILREPPGRGTGGSEYVHRMVTVGTELTVSQPLNNFPLEPAEAYRFIAGGIGITPILAMLRWCTWNARPWHLVYATRNRCRAAFYEELHEFDAGRITWHFDDEAGAPLDVAAALHALGPHELVYCCGPRPLMASVREHLVVQPGVARFESFATRPEAPPATAAEPREASDGAFSITLKKSGQTFQVPADKSILEVLEANGFDVPFSCREGMCATCVTRVSEGTPEHRDYVLTDEERASNQVMCVCVSRALTKNLVLDL